MNKLKWKPMTELKHTDGYICIQSNIPGEHPYSFTTTLAMNPDTFSTLRNNSRLKWESADKVINIIKQNSEVENGG